jgi:dipeptidyl aminopeptidase/acylaminoacyl peptidase
MRTRVLRSIGIAGAFSIGISFVAQGPHAVPVQAAALQESTKKPDVSDAEYRKLDETLSVLRARNAKQFAIESATGIDEASYVAIGGIEQWATIRGQDRSNPVLLFLHGGPGDVTNPWTFALFAPWEKHYTVV